MKNIQNQFQQSHSEFYRKLRPEYFSDSEKIYEVKLPREHLAFELNQISVNQKHDSFETLARRLAEKFISPNLIPQVGPTGGGDGKTDSETYPVSEIISDRWFVLENGWKQHENWAFAISAKADWKSKVKNDVKSIVETARGYSKIYFISNQKIRSKERKETQEKLNKEFGIEVIILDCEWIIEKIYNNDLIYLAVDSLNLSDVYKNEKIRIGKNDASRIKRLEEIEANINNTNRYFEFDYQLVEDTLESAILSRMLEKPKDEVVGKFDRALNLSRKLKNKLQLIRIHYQRAWTFLHWYDDYDNFILEYRKFKQYVQQDSNIVSLELYFNLLNILRSITNNDDINKKNINFMDEEIQYKSLLDICILNLSQPTKALIANTYKTFLNIFNLINNNGEVTNELKILHKLMQDSKTLLEFPFESFKKMIEILGERLPDNQSYDKLIDCIAEISEKRSSEISSGETYLMRGFQKLQNNYYKDSLIYFGKSVWKLAKEERKDYLYLALTGLSEAYLNLGLLWASNNCIIAASSIAVKEWLNEGILNKRLYWSVKEALKNELIIGRIPYLLNWYELFTHIAPQFEEKPFIDEEEIPFHELVDSCLTVRLLNSDFNAWKNFFILPDLLEKATLWLSQDATLYMLGHTDLIDETYLTKPLNLKNLDECYNVAANQPFKEQIIYETSILDSEIIEFKSVILGVNLIIRFKLNKEIAIFAETLLAFLESFLATSFEYVFPSTETIIVNLEDSKEIDLYVIINNNHNNLFEIQFNTDKYAKINNDKIHDLLLELSIMILAKNFIIKETKEYLEKLFKEDELHERQSLIVEHRKFFTLMFGINPKIFMKDWKDSSIKTYNYKRDYNPIYIKEKVKENINFDFGEKLKSLKHNQTQVSSIIDTNLWDNAHWQGFGFYVKPGIPLGIFIAFENENYGKKIFEDWIKRFGKIDQNEEINISIIKGINSNYPFWYRVHIYKNIRNNNLKEGHFIISASKIKEINAINPNNLINLINIFNSNKQYILFPASFKQDGTLEPYLDLGILKRKLTIRDAWEIGENDFDSVVIQNNDKPIIPSNKPDAPIINLLKRKKRE